MGIRNYIAGIVLPIVLTRKKRRILEPVIDDYSYMPPTDTIDDEIRPTDTIEDHIEDLDEEYDGSGTILIDKSKLKPTAVAWLAAVKGKSLGKEYDIAGKRRITVGRLTDNDIVIDDDAISKHHCFIVNDEQSYTIGDAGSSNGTYINDKKITSHKKLNDGDLITLGDTVLEFKSVSLSAPRNKEAEKPKPKPKKRSKG